MADAFDPYRKWLGIPEESRPPTHYQLLGIVPTEKDRDVIELAVIRQSAFVRNYQKGTHADAAAQLLNEIAAAKACLLAPEKRAAYDASLKPAQTAHATPPSSTGPSATPPRPSPAAPRPSPGKPVPHPRPVRPTSLETDLERLSRAISAVDPLATGPRRRKAVSAGPPKAMIIGGAAAAGGVLFLLLLMLFSGKSANDAPQEKISAPRENSVASADPNRAAPIAAPPESKVASADPVRPAQVAAPDTKAEQTPEQPAPLSPAGPEAPMTENSAPPVFVTSLTAPPAVVAPQPAPPVAGASQPAPTHADVAYGPSPHQIMDIYLPPEGKGPYPVVVWYRNIAKPGKEAPALSLFFSAKCAVVAVETRTIWDGFEDKVDAPISYPMNDACRAVQFLRLNAAKWKLDPARIAACGGAEGAVMALYVGCAGERANPQSSDPVERMSTQVTCVAAHRSVPSIDPKRMQEWVPGVEWGAPALGCNFAESLERRDELQPMIASWSPDALLHSGAAPIYFEYSWGLTKPEGIDEMEHRRHSPALGLGFQKLAQQSGVKCYVKFPGRSTEKYKDIWDFIVQKLNARKVK